ncbi:MAG: alpha/beta hydrolase-fold protein [Bacteroidota bacterium]
MRLLIASLILFFGLNSLLKANDTTMTLHYLVRQPKIKSDKPPVIILLHGVGSNEEDLFSFADKLPDKYLVISARAPITLSKGSYAWYEVDFSTGKPIYNTQQEEKSRNIIIQFISELKQKFSFDDQQVYLCGFSQGAIMSYCVGLTRPDLVKGIGIMSGRLLEEVKSLITSNDKLKQLKVFISHGTKDQTLNIQYARTSVAYLKTLNINPVYKEYPEGHTISNEMLIDLINWLK